MPLGRPRLAPPDDELWALYQHTRGDFEAMSRALGLAPVTLRTHLQRIRYERGEPGVPPPMRRVRRTAAQILRDQFDARLAEVEAKIERLLADIAELELRHERERQARLAVVPFAPDHRRLADGGTTVRAQRRARRAG